MLLGAGIPVIEVWDLTDTPIDMCVGFSHAVAGRAVADFAYDAGYRVAATITVADERARPRATAFVERLAARGGKMSDGFNLPALPASQRAVADCANSGTIRALPVAWCSVARISWPMARSSKHRNANFISLKPWPLSASATKISPLIPSLL